MESEDGFCQLTVGAIASMGVPERRLALTVAGLRVVLLECGQVRSGGFGDCGDRVEYGDDGGCPGPRFGDFHPSPAATADQPGGDVQEAVAQRFRFTRCENGGVAGACQHPRPGHQVSGEHDRDEPRLVEGELPGRKLAESGVFGVSDPVLHSGVGAVSGLEELELAGGGVGDERLVAPQSEGRGIRSVRRPRPPSRISPPGLSAGPHASSRHVAMARRNGPVMENPTEYSTRRPRTRFCSVTQFSGSWEAPAPSERISRSRRWLAGTWAIACPRTSMWSAAVFDPALPGRRLAAGN